MTRLVRAMGRITVWAIASVCFGLLVLVGVGPHTGRYRTLTVLTGSMQPGIPVGAMVMVAPERPNQLRVGQVVTYRIPVEDHRVITHRVVRILHGGDRPTFQTKGDANNAPDQWVAQLDGDTVWRVRHVLPHVGLVLNGLRQPAVHTVAVFVLPAVLALVWLVGIWRNQPASPELEPLSATTAPRAASVGRVT